MQPARSGGPARQVVGAAAHLHDLVPRGRRAGRRSAARPPDRSSTRLGLGGAHCGELGGGDVLVEAPVGRGVVGQQARARRVPGTSSSALCSPRCRDVRTLATPVRPGAGAPRRRRRPAAGPRARRRRRGRRARPARRPRRRARRSAGRWRGSSSRGGWPGAGSRRRRPGSTRPGSPCWPGCDRDLLVAGGRSAGARVACRTAPATGAAAVLALAFPLVPPNGRSRAAELALPRRAGARGAGRARRLRGAAGRACVVRGADHAFAVRRRDGRTAEEVAADVRAAVTALLQTLT